MRDYARSLKRTLFVLFVGSLFLASPAFAAYKHYEIIFAGQGELPADAFFDYDTATPSFRNFVVNWAGVQFNLTASANNPGGYVGGTGAASSFKLLSLDPSFGSFPPEADARVLWQGVNEDVLECDASGENCMPVKNSLGFGFSAYVGGPNAPPWFQIADVKFGCFGTFCANSSGIGSWTLVPEPATAALITTGLAVLVLIARRRHRA